MHKTAPRKSELNFSVQLPGSSSQQAGASSVFIQLTSHAADGNDGIVPAEAERVAQRDDVAGRQGADGGHDVERDLRILVLKVDRDGRLAFVDRQNGEDGLHGTGGAKQVAHLRLRS